MRSRAAWWWGLSILVVSAALLAWVVPRSAPRLAAQDLSGSVTPALWVIGQTLALLLALAVGFGVHARAATRARLEAVDEAAEAADDTQRALRKLRADRATFDTRLLQRTQALEETIDEQIAFGDSVSHDLRSPLGNIVLCAEILRDDHADELDEEGAEIVKRVESSARTALSLLERLIAYSRVGREALQRAPVDMRALVAAIFADLQLGHTGPRPRLVLGPLPTVSADPDTLRIVWTNLLTNAIKFSRIRERPVIKVGVRQGADHDTFWVEDNGVGFMPSQADKLFRTFQRLHRADGFEGHGLGLAIVRRIIERHGGRVWARGAPGKGAVLGFHLPTSTRDLTRRMTRAPSKSNSESLR